MPVFIIAEVGSVHDGSLGNAKKLIELAKSCGADAVKFQTHIASAETLKNAPMPPYFKGEPRYDYFERTGFTEDQWKELKAYADEVKIEFLSSPFSEEAVDMLERIGMTRYKIPSGEVTNIPLLQKIALLKKPVILSSGMSTWDELDRAVDIFKQSSCKLSVLQCTTEYPCPYDQVGLNVLTEMQERYNVPVGFSDHTLTIYAPLIAVVRGATVIEKHLTFSRQMYGSDAAHSLEPAEFADMAQGIRAVEVMITHGIDKSDVSRTRDMKEIFEKSVVSSTAISAGTVITEAMLSIKKPGTGIPAAHIGEVVGKKARQDIAADRLIQQTDLQA